MSVHWGEKVAIKLPMQHMNLKSPACVNAQQIYSVKCLVWERIRKDYKNTLPYAVVVESD